jgi:hypothetical protein
MPGTGSCLAGPCWHAYIIYAGAVRRLGLGKLAEVIRSRVDLERPRCGTVSIKLEAIELVRQIIICVAITFFRRPRIVGAYSALRIHFKSTKMRHRRIGHAFTIKRLFPIEVRRRFSADCIRLIGATFHDELRNEPP